MAKRVFVAADWRNLEGRLTALVSGDPVLQAELDAELAGGPKVHSLNAALIYGCKPEEAKDFKINLKGQMRPAYDGGKRFSHAFNYGMGETQMSRTFWVTKEFARGAIEKLSAKYAGVVAWRKALADTVFGVFRYRCVLCGHEAFERIKCPQCVGHAWPVMLSYEGVHIEAARELRTPFGRRRLYLGRRSEGINALTSQIPQGSGGSMWYRTLSLLHGWDLWEQRKVPVPDGALVWTPYDAWTVLRQRTPISVVTGTYDSFYVAADEDAVDRTKAWLLQTMQRPWPELDGATFPAEVSIGYNMGKRTEENPDGLEEVA